LFGLREAASRAGKALVASRPLAEPLLREATLDGDERVRQRATKALEE